LENSQLENQEGDKCIHRFKTGVKDKVYENK